MPDTKYKIQPRHEALKPLCWLEGTWRNESPGKGQFPTIKPFQFMEELKFTSVGQPIFNYRAESWYPDTKAPMHFECGFLKIIPNTNKLVFLLTHTFAVTTIQEGEVCDKQIVLTSTSIERPTEGGNATKVLKIKREITLLDDDCLQNVYYVATETNPELCEHVRIVYQRKKNC